MKKLQKQAFTLVELIVVITILAILGTIAFLSFQGYSVSARDGVRIADINSIKKSLELFIIDKGFYPTPDNSAPKEFSGGLAWTQGTVGDNVITNLVKISKKPTDPLLVNEYTYSITNAKTEYQLGAIYEGGSQLGDNNKTLYTLLISQTNAATKKTATAMVTGTYNGKYLKVSTGGIDYLLTVPSIIDSDITSSTIIPRNLVYNNFQNLPNSYKDLGYTMTGGFDYSPATIVAYSGTLAEFTSSGAVQQQFIANLQTAYNDSPIQSEPGIQEILNATTPAQQQTLVGSYIDNSVGGITGTNTVVILSDTQTGTNGICSTYTNGADLTNVPTDLCSDGNQTSVIDNGAGSTYTRSCEGISGGTTVYCSANHIVLGYPGCDTPDITIGSYTIAACNIGASVAGITSASYGKYFQWGNNYASSLGGSTTATLANATGYGPGNYYSSTAFILPGSGYDWTNPQNNNLWGNNGSVIQRQGPCATGYHLPKDTEWVGIIASGGWGNNGAAMQVALKLPYAGERSWDGSTYNDGHGYYWSSIPVLQTEFDPETMESISYYMSKVMRLNNASISSNSVSMTNYVGLPVRCFKN